MRIKRALYSSSSDQPWYQNSSGAQSAAGSASTANLIASGSSGSGQRYTTIFLTRTQYTTFIYSNSHSSRSSEQAISISLSSSLQSTSSSTISSRATSTSSWSSAFTYQPTTFSTTTTSRVTTHSTTTVRTIVYVTSTRTVLAVSSHSATTSSLKDTTSSISSTAATSSIGAVGGGGGHGSLLVSPEGSSRHSAVIAGGMTGSLAGIALIGLLFLLLFRRRKRQQAHDEKHELAEPRMSSSSQALPSVIAAAGAPRHSDRSPAPQRSPSGRLPIIDHNLIHMDLNHWDRPFAHEDPHLRHDSSPLRLMNPDPTPTPPIILTASSSVSPTNNAHGFLYRQRSALAAALLSVKRSFSSQNVVHRHASGESHTTYTSAHPSAHPSPLHIKDKSNKLTMPSEAILAGAAGAGTVAESRPISSQSAMSNNTIIRHHAPDDPFVTSLAANSPLPSCLQPGNSNNGHGIAQRDFLAPPPLRTRLPIQATPTHAHTQHGNISPLTRSNSECSTRFERPSSPTRSEVSSVSVRSGPFNLASASVVDGDNDQGQRVDLHRSQREQTPNWEIHVNPNT